MSTGPDIGSEVERRAQGVVELIVPELENTSGFYANLGFTVERRSADFVSLIGYGCRLFLARHAEAQAPSVRGCSLRIVVDDVDAVYRRVVEAGAPTGRAPDDRGYGLRDFSIDDPNGFALRFAQVLGS
ncbi:MAG TPA: VOC family protein [Rhodanobacteraceae bacterium]|nr:VOC family protein [Rhodanobacteraceae bacterium]